MKYYRCLCVTILYVYIYIYIMLYNCICIYQPISYSGLKFVCGTIEILKPVASRINCALNISECHVCP
jgi:hypothetical protein